MERDRERELEREREFRFPSSFAVESDSLLFIPALLLLLLLLLWLGLLLPPLLLVLPVLLLLPLLALFVVAFVVPDGLAGGGRARWMKPPHALCDPLLRSTVMTVGGVAFASGRSFSAAPGTFS